MFEIMQRDYSVLRFESEQYHYEIDGGNVKVFRTVNDFVELVTTVFAPIRLAEVDINACLAAPIFTLAPQVVCKHCHRVQE